ncbi:MAG TPA: cytochrome c [Tepidisphaeraceae bacterium]|jgi:mono/diheme cytochrome c family protein|nr:cytochrome c [Tepidisphaeraceae bacterium]
MRHLIAHIALITLAVLLIAFSAFFAWARSRQVILSDEPTSFSRFEPRDTTFDWRAVGRQSYYVNCLNCHGTNGQGWDQYPGLGHAADLLAAPGGRDYLIDVHLYGLTSPRWRAPMPPMGHLADANMAAVLNHMLTNFGNESRLPDGAALYTPDDIAARRGQDLSPSDVNARRPDVPPPGR